MIIKLYLVSKNKTGCLAQSCANSFGRGGMKACSYLAIMEQSYSYYKKTNVTVNVCEESITLGFRS